MPDIVLSTLNAKYIHSAFGLRYLFANLGELQSRAVLAEFDINQRTLDIAEAMLAHNPRIIGLGVYIWNVAPTTELVAALKRIRPEVTIILGGPEVSYESESQPVVQLADVVITGEADLEFATICRTLLGRESTSPCPPTGPGLQAARPDCGLPGIIPAPLPDLERLRLPYDLYTEADIAHRILYVEASRGCPFSCEFCLSSLDIPVRQVPLQPFLESMQGLLDRGARQLKFVDRTFNLLTPTSLAILEFCLNNWRPGRLFHFEMVPDRLPGALREVIARFPPGALQFEVGIQTFNEEAAARISRRQSYERLEDNLRWLRAHTGVHIHADLIAGLPGESLESFGAGFDRLIALRPQEIQVGILKRLRGTPIARHDQEWSMIYNPHPPYDILRNRLLDFVVLQRLKRFARYWDLVGNSGNFVETTPLIWTGRAGTGSSGAVPEILKSPAESSEHGVTMQSPFWSFLRWSDWLYAEVGRTDSIALSRLAELLFTYLTGESGLDSEQVAHVMWRDYQRGGRTDQPGFLRRHLMNLPPAQRRLQRMPGTQKRQSRHLTGRDPLPAPENMPLSSSGGGGDSSTCGTVQRAPGRDGA
jgi:radical SAM superfamily enzyme YgiQ (UPF0313 family)